MPAQVPALDTSGPDVTNAIAKGVSAKATMTNTKNQEMRNTLLKEDMTLEAKTRRNEISKQKHKYDMLDMRSKMFEHGQEGLKWAKNAVNAGEPGAYAAYRQHMVRNFGMPPESFPKFSSFFDTKEDINNPMTGQQKVFNEERFNKWAEQALKTGDEVFAAGEKAKDLYDHIIIYGPEGQEIRQAIKKGETFDPTVEYGEGWKLSKDDADGTDGRNPGQIKDDDRADENQIFNWEKSLGKEGKDGSISAELTDKNSAQIKLYNKKAKEHNKKNPDNKLPLYEWIPEAYKVAEAEEEVGTGLVSVPKKVWKAGWEFVMGKEAPKTTTVGGWAKQPAPEPSKYKKVTSDAEADKMIEWANKSIAAGAPREEVLAGLKEMGIDIE